MNILNKILNYILALLMITLLLSFFITKTNTQRVLCSGNAESIVQFDEENIIKYSKEYYKSKYRENSSNLHYVIYNGGNENGKSYCIVKIKSTENIRSDPEEYIVELKVYDDGKIIELQK